MLWKALRDANPSELETRIRWLRKVYRAACRFRGLRLLLLSVSIFCFFIVYEPWLPDAYYVGLVLGAWPITAWVIQFVTWAAELEAFAELGRREELEAIKMLKIELDRGGIDIDLDKYL